MADENEGAAGAGSSDAGNAAAGGAAGGSTPGAGGDSGAAAASEHKSGTPSAGKNNLLSDDQVADLMQRKGWDKITDADARSRAILESHHNLEQKLGSARITAPKAGEIDKWEGWKDLGLPEKPEYEISRPDDKDGVPYNEGLEKFIMPKLHELKLLPFQVQGLINGIHEYSKSELGSAMQAAEQDKKTMDADLAKEWGGEKDAKVALAQKAARFMGIEAKDATELNAMMGSAGVVRHFAKLGEMLGEDRLKGGEQPKNTFGMSAEGAKAESQRLLKDKSFTDAYYNKTHPEHRSAVEKMSALAKLRAKAGETA